MTESSICPEDLLKVVLPASMIPDGSRVQKVSGTAEYVLRHNIWKYLVERKRPAEEQLLLVSGFFLVSSHGEIDQVEPGKRLGWLVTAALLVDLLQRSWEAGKR